jgi:hypothetical protein
MTDQFLTFESDRRWFIPYQSIFIGIYTLPWLFYQRRRWSNRSLIMSIYYWWALAIIPVCVFITYGQLEYFSSFLERNQIILNTQECGHRLITQNCLTVYNPDLEGECFALAMCVSRPLEDVYVKACLLSLWETFTGSGFLLPQVTLSAASIIAAIIAY